MKVAIPTRIFWCILSLGLVTATFAADLPESIQKSIDKAIADMEAALKVNNEKLIKAFDKQMVTIPKVARLKPDEKQAMIDAIGVEKDTFESHGTIPFSPIMRDAANTYLRDTEKSRKVASDAYDKGIAHFQRTAKDIEAASRLAAEKEKVLAPKVVGIWETTGVDFGGKLTITLFADGTCDPERKRWKFDGDKLIFNTHLPTSKTKAGEFDTCEFTDGTGQSFTGRTHAGRTVIGARVDAPK